MRNRAGIEERAPWHSISLRGATAAADGTAPLGAEPPGRPGRQGVCSQSPGEIGLAALPQGRGVRCRPGPPPHEYPVLSSAGSWRWVRVVAPDRVTSVFLQECPSTSWARLQAASTTAWRPCTVTCAGECLPPPSPRPGPPLLLHTPSFPSPGRR